MLKQKTFVVKIELMGGNNRANRSNRSGSANKSSSRNGNKRTSANKKSAKSSAKRTTSKKRTANKRKSKKVFIPADKIILFCGCVVMVCAILLILTQAIDSRKDAEIKNEFENITKIEKENNVAANASFGTRTSATENDKKVIESVVPKGAQVEKMVEPVETIKGKNDSFMVSQKQTNVSPKENDKSLTQTKTSPNSKKNDSPSQKTSGLQNKSSSQVEKKIAGSSPAMTTSNSSAEMATKNSSAEMATKPDNNAAITNEFSFVTPAKNNAVLVFVFDDGGQNLSQLEKVLALPFPITVAVLPGLVHSKDSAAKIRQSGNELILHQPMQAVNLNVNPGPGAITPSMNEDEIRSVLFKNIYEIGPIKGVNNHEGSLITADAEKMSYVMKLLSDEGLYFLDSRTNADTKVPFVAKSLGYSYYERNVFLDNTKVRADILGEIKKGLDYANKTGCAIMIGHVWSAEILPAILQEIYPTLVKNGYKFSTVSNCPARIN